MVNLGYFLVNSELSFSKAKGYKAAVKNGLRKNTSDLFTIQVQADFDRVNRKSDPNQNGAALR